MELITLPRKEFCERTIIIEGKPFDLTEFPMQEDVFRGTYPEFLMKCGRQVGKTVIEACFIVAESVAYKGFRHLYISPSKEQTSRFSLSKLGKIISGSKKLKRILTGGKDYRANVYYKQWANESEVFLSYAGDSPERVRGISADRVCYDEIQDIPLDEVLPVINEVLAMSDYGFLSYAGTPKSIENPIEYLWQNSTQNEWAIKCEGCDKYNIYTEIAGLGKAGILCHHCGKYVNPYNAQWVSMNDDYNENTEIVGFHIPQVILPRNNPICATNATQEERFRQNWRKILRKLNHPNYGEVKFLNEVMGVSSSSGSRLFSLSDLKRLCKDYRLQRPPPKNYRNTQYRTVTAGIDWGGNGKRGISRTVIHIWGLTHKGELKTIYQRIFPVENPADSLDDIKRICREFGVNIIAADAGEGTVANPLLRREFGYEKVFPMRYMSQKRAIEWDELLHQGCYKLDRTIMIDNLSLEIKKENSRIIFPHEEDCELIFKDCLSLFESVTANGKKVWEHHPDMPDDSFHAMLFGWLATKIVTQDFNFYE